jgi:cell division protein FtsB
MAYFILNMTVFGQRSFYALYKAKRDLNLLKEKNTTLITSNSELETKIKLLKDDPFTIQKVAIEKYGMGKKGTLILKY